MPKLLPPEYIDDALIPHHVLTESVAAEQIREGDALIVLMQLTRRKLIRAATNVLVIRITQKEGKDISGNATELIQVPPDPQGAASAIRTRLGMSEDFGYDKIDYLREFAVF